MSLKIILCSIFLIVLTDAVPIETNLNTPFAIRILEQKQQQTKHMQNEYIELVKYTITQYKTLLKNVFEKETLSEDQKNLLRGKLDNLTKTLDGVNNFENLNVDSIIEQLKFINNNNEWASYLEKNGFALVKSAIVERLKSFGTNLDTYYRSFFDQLSAEEQKDALKILILQHKTEAGQADWRSTQRHNVFLEYIAKNCGLNDESTNEDIDIEALIDEVEKKLN